MGFAVAVDDQESTDPGTVVNEPGPSTWLELEDGVHWLHIRAVLPGDVGGPVAHVRIGVDTVPPEIAELRSLTHPVEVVSTDPDVTVEWDEPVDLSGVVGYEAWLSPEEFFDPDATEDVPESTSLPIVEFTVPEDGTWYVHVRAQDAAGLWGPHVSYPLAVDTAPPGAPAVVGSHVDAVATSQRYVVMDFVEAEGDNVDRWAALVDDEPTTVPDVSLARSEARIAATVEPGDSWLHVRGRDSLGRWGPVTHTKLVVTDDPVVVDVASGQSFWSVQDVDLVCPAAQDLTLVAVASDSSTAVIGALDDVSTGRCVVEWDVTETDDDERVWPDGDYELFVVDDTDFEVSERVAVSVQVDLTVSERLLADYGAGRVGSEDLASMLLQTMSDPLAVPERYRAGAEPDVPPAWTSSRR